MFLSDATIRQYCSDSSLRGIDHMIHPFADAQLQPASYDVLLGEEILGASHGRRHPEFDAGILDLRRMPEVGEFMKPRTLGKDGIVIKPGDFLLATTHEHFAIPPWVRASIEGKSSLARLGLIPHVAAGYIDPGFRGKITLEIVNLGPFHIRIRPGDSVAQIAFALTDRACERPYGHPELKSHYQNQNNVQGSRYGR